MRSTAELCWYEDTTDLQRRWYPCRICEPSEGIHIGLEPLWDQDEVVLIQALEFPRTRPFFGNRDRLLVERASLHPYRQKKDNTDVDDCWNKTIWNKYSQQRRVEARQRGNALTKSDVKAGYLYLERILAAAKEKGHDADRLMMEDGNNRHDDNDDDDDDDDSDLEIPYAESRVAGDPGLLPPLDDYSGKRREPLRPGDVVQYTHPVFRAGDKRGQRTATVLSTDPNRTPVLVLDSGDVLPSNDVFVKRIRILDRGTLVPHDGIMRPIAMFRMKRRALKEGDFSVRAGLQKEMERLGSILHTNRNRLQQQAEADGFAPMDMLHKFRKPTTTDTNTDSVRGQNRNRREMPVQKVSQRRKQDTKVGEGVDSGSDSSSVPSPSRKVRWTAAPVRGKDARQGKKAAVLYLDTESDDDSSGSSVPGTPTLAPVGKLPKRPLTFLNDGNDAEITEPSIQKKKKRMRIDDPERRSNSESEDDHGSVRSTPRANKKEILDEMARFLKAPKTSSPTKPGGAGFNLSKRNSGAQKASRKTGAIAVSSKDAKRSTEPKTISDKKDTNKRVDRAGKKPPKKDKKKKKQSKRKRSDRVLREDREKATPESQQREVAIKTRDVDSSDTSFRDDSHKISNFTTPTGKGVTTATSSANRTKSSRKKNRVYGRRAGKQNVPK